MSCATHGRELSPGVKAAAISRELEGFHRAIGTRVPGRIGRPSVIVQGRQAITGDGSTRHGGEHPTHVDTGVVYRECVDRAIGSGVPTHVKRTTSSIHGRKTAAGATIDIGERSSQIEARAVG